MGPVAQTTLNIVTTPHSILSQKLNNDYNLSLLSENKDKEELAIKKARAEAIDAYFGKHNVPLEGMGMKMVEEALVNDIDWRLIPAIAMRESTGGKFACKKATFNSFGWGSCKIGFKSNEHAIEIVAKNLGGNNPNTARHYANKSTLEILRAYNPPSIVPKYGEQVISIMDTIGPEDPQAVDEHIT